VNQGRSNLFVCGPDAGELLASLGRSANEIKVLTFWSLEQAYRNGRLRYHLGQLAMIGLMNELAGKGCRVYAYICDSESRSLFGQQIGRFVEDIEISERFIKRLGDPSIKIRRMSDLVEDMHRRSASAGKIVDQVVVGALRFRNFIQREPPAATVLQELSRFRAYGSIEVNNLDGPTSGYLTKLQREFPAPTAAELLAALYASSRRPKWFDAFWVGDLAAWIATQEDAAQSLILEANRSAYSWLTHTCFLKIGATLTQTPAGVAWPVMCFVNPVLSSDGQAPMQLASPETAIFAHFSAEGIAARLADANIAALESYRCWFLPHLPSATERPRLEQALLERVQALRGKLGPGFLIREEPPAAAVLALPAEVRIGLCLSGGGFRATFFHLGLIRLLQDLDLLKRVTAVYSVSGGSILAANLAKEWDQYVQSHPNAETFFEASLSLRRLAQFDVRGRIFRRCILPWHWFRGWSTRCLERYYRKVGGFDMELGEMRASPTFAFLATSMQTGKVVSFSRDGLHDGERPRKYPDCPVARAVAASSAFPPVFPPIRIAGKDLLDRGDDHEPQARFITDGGVYDNLGLTKLAADAEAKSDERWCTIMLVSDASAPFDSSLPGKFGMLINRAIRTTDILMKRVGELEARALSSAAGARDPSTRRNLVQAKIDTIVPPEGSVARMGDRTEFVVQDERVQKATAEIRTDLDKFSKVELASLMRHGYEVGLHSLMIAEMVPPGFLPRDPCGVPFPRMDVFITPRPRERTRTGTSEQIERLRTVLGISSKRRWRIFSLPNWQTWLVVSLAIAGIYVWRVLHVLKHL
jgi:predicted acylesterase/phospholipase RssA